VSWAIRPNAWARFLSITLVAMTDDTVAHQYRLAARMCGQMQLEFLDRLSIRLGAVPARATLLFEA